MHVKRQRLPISTSKTVTRRLMIQILRFSGGNTHLSRSLHCDLATNTSNPTDTSVFATRLPCIIEIPNHQCTPLQHNSRFLQSLVRPHQHPLRSLPLMQRHPLPHVSNDTLVLPINASQPLRHVCNGVKIEGRF
ncbi:hypothetical protein DOTSEDRAFT_91067 [Dothistroma septosporum NZE10]|uniref:Uncharacterized protein n=1 Tax=Dothistroma septosporum (strain NZE10 / CBS 128990) TaxID=675120 RepID=N1PI75_DOTSN|nr:hypothetical protein DOTSEDRAFT_91067 [Dothistroma septosporum NZE10]